MSVSSLKQLVVYGILLAVVSQSVCNADAQDKSIDWLFGEQLKNVRDRSYIKTYDGPRQSVSFCFFCFNIVSSSNSISLTFQRPFFNYHTNNLIVSSLPETNERGYCDNNLTRWWATQTSYGRDEVSVVAELHDARERRWEQSSMGMYLRQSWN